MKKDFPHRKSFFIVATVVLLFFTVKSEASEIILW